MTFPCHDDQETVTRARVTPPLAPPELADALQRQLGLIVARRGAAGAQYLLLRDAQPQIELCLGMADVAGARPVTAHTTFNSYSITKPLTALAILALAADYRLDLDAPIGDAAGVDGLAYGSVRQTLLHRAGFPNPYPLRWIHADDAHRSFDHSAFARARLDALRNKRPRPARYAYSNLGYLALGLAIERVTGHSYAQALRTLVFEPSQLAADEQLDLAIERPQAHARGHLRRFGWLDLTLGVLIGRAKIVQSVEPGWVRLQLHHVNGAAYGGLIANARGLARFGHAVLGLGTDLNPSMRRLLFDIVPGLGPPRSLGWFAGMSGGQRWFAHAGGGVGGYGELRLYPELRAVSVLLTNGAGLVDARCLDRLDPIWIARG